MFYNTLISNCKLFFVYEDSVPPIWTVKEHAFYINRSLILKWVNVGTFLYIHNFLLLRLYIRFLLSNKLNIQIHVYLVKHRNRLFTQIVYEPERTYNYLSASLTKITVLLLQPRWLQMLLKRPNTGTFDALITETRWYVRRRLRAVFRLVTSA